MPKAESAEGSGDGGKESLQQPGDVPEMQPVVAGINGILQLLWIEHPPLGAANTSSIRQRSHAARAVPGQPAVGTVEADAVLGRKFHKAPPLLKVLGDQPETALLRQTGIGMAMHGCVRSGLVGRTSTRSGLTPPCQLNNLLRQNS